VRAESASKYASPEITSARDPLLAASWLQGNERHVLNDAVSSLAVSNKSNAENSDERERTQNSSNIKSMKANLVRAE
jgi:hypothetical protein